VRELDVVIKRLLGKRVLGEREGDGAQFDVELRGAECGDQTYSSSDTNARYDVLGVGSAPATFVNGSTGSSGWVSLGTYALAQGTGASVQLTSSGTGCARADAVKFVRRS
jgi:hypothetical protein